MEIIAIAWLILTFLISSSGRDRKIGFSRTFIICLLLSPIIGLIFLLLSEKNTESLMKLKISHDSGSITKEEYEKGVRKITPNNEDKSNARLGYLVIGAVILVVYLYMKYF